MEVSKKEANLANDRAKYLEEMVKLTKKIRG